MVLIQVGFVLFKGVYTYKRTGKISVVKWYIGTVHCYSRFNSRRNI